MRVVRRQSRTKIWGVLVVLLLLGVVGTVSYGGWRQSVAPPRVTNTAPRFLGHQTTFPVAIRASRGHLTSVEVRLVQGGKTATIAKPDSMSLDRQVDLPVTVETSKLGFHEGAATIEVRARDDFWRPLKPDERPVATFPVTIDLTPPKVEILASTQYVSPGGVCLVAFRVEGAARSELTVGKLAVPSFAMGPPEKGARVALVPLAWDYAPGTPVAIRAEDEAGNVATRGIAFELKPRKFPRDRIEIRDSFLELKVPELLPQRPPSQPLLEGFLVINRDQRREAEAQKRKIGSKTAPEPLWEGPFVQPRNTKVFANFAETRTYYYQGREIDSQVHYGFDLASTKQSPVPAANRGVVAFTGALSIYGNAVVLDHGLGLQTLYGHLSSIEVKVGDKIAKGQELGRSGTTGLAIGDHIHYETLVNGISITPVEWWDAKWIRDRINLPLRTAGLPEIKGLEGGTASDGEPPRAPRPVRRRRA